MRSLSEEKAMGGAKSHTFSAVGEAFARLSRAVRAHSSRPGWSSESATIPSRRLTISSTEEAAPKASSIQRLFCSGQKGTCRRRYLATDFASLAKPEGGRARLGFSPLGPCS